MSVEAAKLIGAGLAVIGLAGVGIGIGNVFSAFITAVARNPAAQATVFPFTMLGFALVEAIALFALLIAFLILFS
ncbi:MAG: F0F1-type ATP synthase membrane subunit c/vacuolar-type H+-ATPase subunit K [Alphaproteobacteria bacterium]|jgi:F0F1-type ATP synthase membrane subunit c/vacuolar-type H+-ATPase subunit K